MTLKKNFCKYNRPSLFKIKLHVLQDFFMLLQTIVVSFRFDLQESSDQTLFFSVPMPGKLSMKAERTQSQYSCAKFPTCFGVESLT